MAHEHMIFVRHAGLVEHADRRLEHPHAGIAVKVTQIGLR